MKTHEELTDKEKRINDTAATIAAKAYADAIIVHAADAWENFHEIKKILLGDHNERI